MKKKALFNKIKLSNTKSLITATTAGSQPLSRLRWSNCRILTKTPRISHMVSADTDIYTPKSSAKSVRPSSQMEFFIRSQKKKSRTDRLGAWAGQRIGLQDLSINLDTWYQRHYAHIHYKMMVPIVLEPYASCDMCWKSI